MIRCIPVKEVGFYLAYYLSIVFCAALLWSRPWLLTVIFLGASLLLLRQWYSAPNLFFYGVAFVLGPVGEVIAVQGGAWKYSGDTTIIPPWLPFAWGLTILFIIRVAEVFSRLNTDSPKSVRASVTAGAPAPPPPGTAGADAPLR